MRAGTCFLPLAGARASTCAQLLSTLITKRNSNTSYQPAEYVQGGAWLAGPGCEVDQNRGGVQCNELTTAHSGAAGSQFVQLLSTHIFKSSSSTATTAEYVQSGA